MLSGYGMVVYSIENSRVRSGMVGNGMVRYGMVDRRVGPGHPRQVRRPGVWPAKSP